MHPLLLVDDEKDNLQALQRLLRNQFEVTAVSTPAEALALVQQKPFHVIVSDQRMPEMTGVELLERVMKIRPMTTRILLTGYTDVESVIGAINRGNIYRYVAKPWDPEDLKQTLRQADEAYLMRREIEEKNVALQKSNSELEHAVQELKVLDRAKSRFLSLVSHELNTPLTVLLSFSELLQSYSDPLPDVLKKAIASVSGASARLGEIIQEVIEFVRLESDPSIRLATFDWNKEILQSIQGLEGLRSSKQIECGIESSQKAESRCDIEKMRIALRHLFEDTFRRAPANSKVRIVRAVAAEAVLLRIEREGDALPDNALAALDIAGDVLHHQRGLGLRLALVRRIAEQHSGSLTIPKNGKGLHLELSLPG